MQPTIAPQKLSRSQGDRLLAGVLGGIARYFGWSASLTRMAFLLFLLRTGFSGAIVYAALWILMPSDV